VGERTMTIRTLKLFPFQRQALDDLAAKFKAEQAERLAIVLPTGGGKTVTFARQAVEYLEANPGKRVLVLVDTDALVDQTVTQMLRTAPHLSVGIVKAEKNEIHADVLVGSVQTLRNPVRRKPIRGVGLVIVDECEMAVTRSCMDILTDIGCFGGGAIATGYTATLMRSDEKKLSTVWQGVAFQRDLSWMIRRKYLIPPRGLAIEVPDLDLRTVRSTRSDFRDEELGEALAESLAPQVVAEAVMEHARDRKILAFFPTIASCYVFAAAFEDVGIEARVIHGGMSTADRKATMAWHKRGTVLVNCMVLTKGYDDTEIDCIVMGRPTKSKRLYIQMVGRGLRNDLTRPYEEQDCLLLDVVGASTVNDLRSIVDLSELPLKADDAHSGKTLTELEDDLDAGGGVPDEDMPYWRGEVVTREFDPLGRPSTKVWLRTKGGTFFVPAGKRTYVFIMQWPAAGEWSVAWCGKTNMDGRPQMTEHRGLPLDQALSWAEDLAVDMGADLNTASKRAPWRRKPASEKTVSLARTLGLKVAGKNDASGLFVPEERAGDLSDRIALVIGSRRIDPIVKAVRSR
jgi:superfamily II DNA or RNA helicase